MGLVTMDGQPIIGRQQRRDLERKNQKDLVALMAEMNRHIGQLFIRTDILVKLLKEQGVTDEQIQTAEQSVLAEYKEGASKVQ